MPTVKKKEFFSYKDICLGICSPLIKIQFVCLYLICESHNRASKSNLTKCPWSGAAGLIFFFINYLFGMIIMGSRHFIMNGARLRRRHKRLVISVARGGWPWWRHRSLVWRWAQTHRSDIWYCHLSLPVKNTFERV